MKLLVYKYRHIIIISIIGLVFLFVSVLVWNFRGDPVENLSQEFEAAQEFTSGVKNLDIPLAAQRRDDDRLDVFTTLEDNNYRTLHIEQLLFENGVVDTLGLDVQETPESPFNVYPFRAGDDTPLENINGLGQFQSFRFNGKEYLILYSNITNQWLLQDVSTGEVNEIIIPFEISFFVPVYSHIYENTLIVYLSSASFGDSVHLIARLNLETLINENSAGTRFDYLSQLGNALAEEGQDIVNQSEVQGIISDTFQSFLSRPLFGNDLPFEFYIQDQYYVAFTNQNTALISTNQVIRRVWEYNVESRELRELTSLRVSANSHVQYDYESRKMYLVDYEYNFLKWVDVDNLNNVQSGNLDPSALDQLVVSQYSQTIGSYPSLLREENGSLYHWNGIEFAPLAVLNDE